MLAFAILATVPTARRFETHFDGAFVSLFASELELFLSAELKRALVGHSGALVGQSGALVWSKWRFGWSKWRFGSSKWHFGMVKVAL